MALSKEYWNMETFNLLDGLYWRKIGVPIRFPVMFSGRGWQVCGLIHLPDTSRVCSVPLRSDIESILLPSSYYWWLISVSQHLSNWPPALNVSHLQSLWNCSWSGNAQILPWCFPRQSLGFSLQPLLRPPQLSTRALLQPHGLHLSFQECMCTFALPSPSCSSEKYPHMFQGQLKCLLLQVACLLSSGANHPFLLCTPGALSLHCYRGS